MKIKNNYIRNLKKEELSFYGYPVKYRLEDYGRVLGRIKRKAQKEDGILSVYGFGKVSAPGISDIDLIFVLKEGSKLPPLLKKNYIDDDSKYLVFHPFLIFTENIFKNIRYIYPSSDYIKIYGRKISIYMPKKHELKKIKTCLVADTILRHLPVDFLYILLSKKINIRMCLLRLNALSHTFRMFYGISGMKKPVWGKFSRKVKRLRKNWFQMNDDAGKDMLLGLLKESVYISSDFVKEFDAFLSKDKNYLLHVKQRDVLFRGYKARISFAAEWHPDKAISQMISHFIKHKNFYSILPISLLKQLCCYSSAQGRLSRYIRKRLSINCFQEKLDPVLEKRIINLNEQVELANSLKHSHFPCFFPLGYKTERGLKNKMILLYVIITSNSLFRRVLFYIRSTLKKIAIDSF
ncbi:hypothetical protein J4204_05725 [Candidatus Woesearchaeota archaeon]|nr:hypothetical protein [Candidatus Woesearchaeota archaeon]